jgi:hypothetical protein
VTKVDKSALVRMCDGLRLGPATLAVIRSPGTRGGADTDRPKAIASKQVGERLEGFGRCQLLRTEAGEVFSPFLQPLILCSLSLVHRSS